MNCGNTLYETRHSNYVGICHKTAPSKGILFANILIGPAHPGLFASKISMNSTFIVI